MSLFRGVLLFLFSVVFCGGCSNAPYEAPSTAAAQQAVNSARGNIDSALSENQSAIEHNRRARTNAEAIDNKASVIDRYWQ